MSDTGELLGGLRTAFLNRVNRDGVLSRFWGMVGDRTAGQEDAANYAARLGEVLSETLLEETVAIGDGRVRFAEALADTDPDELLNTVNGTLGQLMKHAYRMVNDAGAQAQKIADEANGLGLRSVLGNYPDERLQGLYRKIAEAAEQSQVASHQSEEKSAQDADRRAERVGAPPVGGDRKSGGTVESWLGEPVVNNVQAFYDEHVRANAEARFHAGLAPVIVRTAAPGCCNWCASRAGVYEYDSVQDKGNEVFRRHKFCRCTVAYFCDGARTEVWGRKHWEADRQTLEQRKTYGLDNKKTLPAPSEEYVRQEEGKVLVKAEKRGIIQSSGKVGDRDEDTVITRVYDIIPTEASIQKEIDLFVQSFAYAKEEHSLVISPSSGHVVELTGGNATVKTQLAGEDQLLDAIVIHNHPLDQFSDTFYDSFSKKDLIFAIEYKCGKQYLVSGTLKNAFEFIEPITADELSDLYEEARYQSFVLAGAGIIDLEHEQLERMRILSKITKKVQFYEL